MRLGVMLGYWMPDPWDPTELVLEAERLGYDSAWTAEALKLTVPASIFSRSVRNTTPPRTRIRRVSSGGRKRQPTRK